MHGSKHLVLIVGLLLALAFRALAQNAAPEAGGTASAAAEAQVVGLDECIVASEKSAPALATARLVVDSAAAQLAYGIGSNGLKLGESAGYAYAGPLNSSSSTLPSNLGYGGNSEVSGNNVSGTLSLSGPSTDVGLTLQQGSSNSAQQSTAIGVTGKQTIYDGYPGGQPSAAVSEARYSYQIAQVAYDAALKSVIYQVKNDYYTLLGDQKGLVAWDATVKQAEEELAQMQGYLKAGRATTIDVLQAQVALVKAQLDFRTARNTTDVDRRKLSLAVGWPIEREYSVADAPTPETPETDPAKSLAAAYANRSELRTFSYEIAQAQVDVTLQKSQASPTVALDGAFEMAQAWTSSSAPDGILSLGVDVILPPVYDGKQQASLVREKQDTLDAYEVQLGQERQSIAIDLANALFAVKDSSDRLDLAKQNLDAAQGVYDMQKAKFNAGSASSVDVMTALSSLASAQVGLESAKSTYNLAILSLDNVMGL